MTVLLIIDDNEDDIELCKISFASKHAEPPVVVDDVFDVSGCKNIFSPDRHHAVIVDWNLPDGTGADAAAFIREQSADVPIIFLSGCFTDGMKEQATAYKPLACLEKEIWPGHHNKIKSLLNLPESEH